MMSDLSAQRITQRLRSVRLGRPTMYFFSVGSTNDVVHGLAAAGAPDGLLVVAEEQAAGRGRLDRSWWAPAGSSLLMSLLLRPPPEILPMRRAGQLTMCLGLGAVEGIEATVGLRPALKWPNDLVWQGRKLGGMLTELRTLEDRLEYAVLGLGVNVNILFDRSVSGASAQAPIEQSPEIPAELLTNAVSLLMAVGKPVDRVQLLAAILEHCETWYERLLAGKPLHEAWAAHLDTLGREVMVTRPSGTLSGTAVGVTPEGGLVIRQLNGQQEIVWAGDITRLR